MEVRTCRKCGKLFNYIAGEPLYAMCRENEEEVFRAVKNWLYDHKGANFYQVHDALQVDTDLLQKWVREGRLEFAKGVDSGITCERCGKPIPSGRYCEECKAELAGDLKSVYPEKAKELAEKNMKAKREEKDRMRFLRNRQ